MKSLSLELVSDQNAKYLQIAAAIRRAIQQGQLTPGERLPSVRMLAVELSCNRHTVMSALQELIVFESLYLKPKKQWR